MKNSNQLSSPRINSVTKRSIAIMIIFAMLFNFLPVGLWTGDAKAETVTITPNYSWYGDGTSNNFSISSAAELLGFANLVNGLDSKTATTFSGKAITLSADVDLTGVDWLPIGDNRSSFGPSPAVGPMFNGVFNGGNHSINGISVNILGSNENITIYGGLFGVASTNSIIKNIRLINPTISVIGGKADDINSANGGAYVGGIVGVIGGTVDNCHVIGGTITVGCNAGGSSDIASGGIAGRIGENTGIVEKCSSSAKVSSMAIDTTSGTYLNQSKIPPSLIGGVVGDNRGTIKDSTSSGEIVNNIPIGTEYPKAYTGGIAGLNNTNNISNCYFNGTVSGITSKGAILGGIMGGTEFSNTVSNCYYNKDKVISPSETQGTGLTTAELKDSSKFVSWDFTNTWTMGTEYPVLKAIMDLSECKCELGTFTVTSDNNIVIPYGQESTTYTLQNTVPIIDTSKCTVAGHQTSRTIKFTYIIKSTNSANGNGTICDGASINSETKVITFTKAGTYTVEVFAGDPLSQKIQSAAATFTVKNEVCTDVIPSFTFQDQSVTIPYASSTGSLTFTNPNLTLTGDCKIAEHKNKSIEYSYSVVNQDSTIGSATFDGNELFVSGEGKVTVRLTASAPGTGAKEVSKDAVINFTKEKCSCTLDVSAFEGGNITIPFGKSATQKTLSDPYVTFKPCEIAGHSFNSTVFEYSILPDHNTAGATINNKILTVSNNGSVTVKLKVSVPGTDAVVEKTATFNVGIEDFQIPDYLKTIKILANNSATLGWNSNFSGSMNIKIKDSNGTVVKTATVNIADRKYTVPAEVLTGLDNYTAELTPVGSSTVLTTTIEILTPQTSILFNPNPNTYYDNNSTIGLSWRCSNEIQGETKTVTVRKGTSEYTDFTVVNNSVTINNIQKPTSSKDTYTVSIAISYGGKVLTSDNFSLYVYRTNSLEIVNDSGESLTPTLLISNVNAAAAMSQTDLLLKANSFNLQRIVKLKQAYSLFGEDKYQWTVANAKIASISGSNYSNGYYSSNSTMTITGLMPGETTVTVRHVATGTTTTFNVKIETLEGKLYILKAPINASVKLQYTVGIQTKSITTNSLGMAAIFERGALSGNIVAYGESIGKIYMGNTPVAQLASGEIANKNYPVKYINVVESTNINIKLSAAAKETIFTFMGKKIIQNGKLIKDVNLSITGYLLLNGNVVETKTQALKISKADYENVALNFDSSRLGEISPSDKIKFVYEITGDSNSPYAPAYATVDSTSGTSFKDISVTLQAKNDTQTAYINSLLISDSLNGEWKDISSQTSSVKIDESTSTKYVKAILCWPKNQTGTVSLVNSKGDVVGVSSITTTNSSLPNMNYGWQEVLIKVDSKLVAVGKSFKFSYKLNNTVAQQISQIPSNFVIANLTGIKNFEMASGMPFVGAVSTGSTGMKILGNKSFNVDLGNNMGISYKYKFDEDPLNGKFIAVIGKAIGEETKEETYDKFEKEFEKTANIVENKTKYSSGDKGKGEASLTGNVGGYLMGDIKYTNGQWIMVPMGGGLYGGIEAGYSFSQTQFIGPIPVCYGVEFNAGVELTAGIDVSRVNGAVTGDNFYQMFDVYLKLNGGISAYGGIGFNFGWIAARIGLFGELGLEYYFRSSFIENVRRNGGQLSISGSIGIEAVFKFLWFKKRYVLCEAGFEKKFKPNGYDFTNNGGFSSPINNLKSMRFVQQISGGDGKLYDLYENNYTLDDRDYLKNAQHWNSGAASVNSIVNYSLVSLSQDEPKTIGTNLYPYGYPMLSEDGKIMTMLSDFNSTDVNNTGAAYSIKDVNGNWSNPARIFNQNTPASSLAFDGSKEFAAAAWESTENTSATNNTENVSSVDIVTTLAKSEIYASIYNGSSWTTKKITSNNEADMAPAIGVNNGHAIVVWQKVDPSADDPMKVVSKNELWYSEFNGTTWSEEKKLDSGDAGNIKSFSVAVASDGAAMVTAAVDVDKNDSTFNDTDIFNYYIKDGTVTRKNITNNDSQDGSPKIVARKIKIGNEEKEYFFNAWYSEKTDANSSVLSKDIKLNVFKTDGEKADGFPSSMSNGNGTANFNFTKSTDTALNSLGIVWSQTSVTNSKTYQTLYAGMLTEADGRVITTPGYSITSVDPDKEEIAKFDATSKVVGNNVNIEAMYLKNNLENVKEDGSELNIIKATSSDLISASKVITEAIDISYVDYDESGIEKNALLPIKISVYNNGMTKVKSLMVKANGQVYNIAKAILPNETLETTIDYKVDEAISDVDMEITPEYDNGISAKKASTSVVLKKPDLKIESVALSGTGEGGKRIFDVNLQNLGIGKIAESGYKAQLKVYEDLARKKPATIENLYTGEKATNGQIIISDPDKLKDIDAGKGTCKVGYTILPDAYDSSGNKTLYIDANIIDSNGSIVNEVSYGNNKGGITFTSPKLLYPSQFEVTAIQGQKSGFTTADITVKNLYPEQGKDTLRVRLMNQNTIIEEKSIPINLGAEASMNQNITFANKGTDISFAFMSDVEPTPTPSPTPLPTPTPTQTPISSPIITPVVPIAKPTSAVIKAPIVSAIATKVEQKTIKGNVIDKNGKIVEGVDVIVITEANGNKTVQVKSSDIVLLMQPDGTMATIKNISKLGFEVLGNTDAMITISADGTIQVKNIANGTEVKIAITYDLGNGQKITIGSMSVKVSSNGEVSLASNLIDPYGTITDATTGKIITGADIKLYYANTERNKASGKKPDTLVELPIIDGFKPNDNKNPQISDNFGTYGFLVFPTADYYIVATKDGYSKYVSPTISVETEIVKHDIKMKHVENPSKISNTHNSGLVYGAIFFGISMIGIFLYKKKKKNI